MVKLGMFLGMVWIFTACNGDISEPKPNSPETISGDTNSTEVGSEEREDETNSSSPTEPEPIILTLKEEFINNVACDRIIDKTFLEICYDDTLKAAKSVAYRLSGALVNELNIKDRPHFYQEESVPEEYRATYYDYTNSGYDRGHLAPDAAFDWSEESLEATYSLANIIPQLPEVNQHRWVDVEGYARSQARRRGEIGVLNVVKYGGNPNSIGRSGISVSEGFYKILYNSSENYKECFYYLNKPIENGSSDQLNDHRIDCSTVTY